MRSLLDWKEALLIRHGINNFDGRPIYQYRLTEQEYNKLDNLLRILFVRQGIQGAIDGNTLMSALFVIYFAESWRRNYKGGVHNRDVMYNGIFGNNRISQNIWTTIVVGGIKRLGLALFKNEAGDNEYHLTVLRQGGIPVNYLATVGGGLLNTIIRTFAHFSSYKLSIDQKYDYLKKNGGISRTYQYKEFYQLIIDLIDVLVDLNDRYDLGNVENPIQALGNIEWRDKLPLNVTDTTFIDSILTGLVNKSKEIGNVELEVSFKLIQNDGTYSVNSEIELNPGVYSKDFFTLTDDDVENLGQTCNLIWKIGDSEHELGFLNKVNNNDSYRTSGLSANYQWNNDFESTIVLRNIFTEYEVDLSIQTDLFTNNDDPHWFVKDLQGNWIFRKSGSIKTVQREIYGLIPESISQIINNQQLTLIPLNVAGFQLFNVAENSIIMNNGNSFNVSLHDQNDDNQIELRRRQNAIYIPYYSRSLNKEIFLGFPQVFEKFRTGRTGRIIGLNQLQWYNPVNEDWEPVNNDVFGSYKIRKINQQGVTEFTRKITVLPEDLSIIIQQGNVTINSQSNFDLIGPTGTNLIGRILNFDNNSPEFGDVILSNLSGRDVKIRLPFPHHQISLTNQNGEILTFDNDNTSHELYINDLYGFQLNISNFSANPERFVIKASLHKKQKNGNGFIVDPVAFVSEKVLENTLAPAVGGTIKPQSIDLYRFKKKLLLLFAANIGSTQNSSLDDKIIIECGVPNLLGNFDNSCSFTISKYTFTIPKIQGTQEYQIKTGITRVGAFKLNEPITTNSFLEITVDTGQNLNIQNLPSSDGKWFIYPLKGELIKFRPLLIKSPDFVDLNVPNHGSLAEVSSILNADDRQDEFQTLLNDASGDFNDPLWMELYYLYQNTNHLPFEAFEVWKNLVANEKALVTFYFYLLTDTSMIETVTDQFSLLWRTIKLSNWVSVFQSFQAQYMNDSVTDFMNLIEPKMKYLSSNLGLGQLVQCLYSGNGPAIQQIIAPSFSNEFNNLVNGLDCYVNYANNSVKLNIRLWDQQQNAFWGSVEVFLDNPGLANNANWTGLNAQNIAGANNQLTFVCNGYNYSITRLNNGNGVSVTRDNVSLPINLQIDSNGLISRIGNIDWNQPNLPQGNYQNPTNQLPNQIFNALQNVIPIGQRQILFLPIYLACAFRDDTYNLVGLDDPLVRYKILKVKQLDEEYYQQAFELTLKYI